MSVIVAGIISFLLFCVSMITVNSFFRVFISAFIAICTYIFIAIPLDIFIWLFINVCDYIVYKLSYVKYTDVETSDIRDNLLFDVGEYLVKKNRASIGLIQRKFHVSFSEAVQIMSQLFDAGVVGSDVGTKSRKILMSSEAYADCMQSYIKSCENDVLKGKDDSNFTSKEIKESVVESECLNDEAIAVETSINHDVMIQKDDVSNVVVADEVLSNDSCQLNDAHTDCIFHRVDLYNDEFDYMNGHDFEYFCASLLRRNDFTSVEVTPGSNDNGIDILAVKNGVRYGIQCKRYASNVGVKAVQEAYSGAVYYDCDKAVVLTNSYFTKQAEDFAKKVDVRLWNRNMLISLLNGSCNKDDWQVDDADDYIVPSEDELNRTSRLIQSGLYEVGIPVTVVGVKCSQFVTRYALSLATGVSVRKIRNRSKDLQLWLAADSIRILVPIPGTSLVGIEVPNKRKFSVV